MKTLIVQQGHYGRTSGKTGTAGEQDMARSVAVIIRNTAPAGWQARLIPADPSSETSYMGGNAFVAIHGDGSTNPAAKGASVGYRDSVSKPLALAWKAAYKKVGWPGAWKEDNYTIDIHHYYGTGHATAQGSVPAIIVEVGMMTNAVERSYINRHHYEIAKSIWMAVAPAAFASTGRYEVIVKKTLMYDGPSIFDKPVMTLVKGNQVTKKSPTSPGGWFKARRYFKTGYVYNHYFKKL